ncbi:hypothetical protein [Methylorubrum extorquens]|uniref:Uncharacterized protein n=1 Tax=Methylorubrum extorquens TaxID=408 RepID=A0AAX3WCK4_METEX|nr:hypothetical protein [Methylorubrum extorquens]WHQ68646.1 hypothetical protein KEC54_20085 [Methylorubrum extorquens]
MTDRSAICDRIRTAPNARVANGLADRLTAADPHPAFIQRIGARWALMHGGDRIAFEGDFSDVRARLAACLDH